ncbi:MAG: M23 family metallopeptidase [Bellilinea sp.]
MITPKLSLFLILLFSLSLTACQAVAAAGVPSAGELPAPQAIIQHTRFPAETQIPLPSATPPSSNNEAEQPLRFTFPTPADQPISLWRPPLYEVPWALTPHDHFYFLRPIAADEVNWPLADYRYGDYFPGTDIVHTGIDIDAERGTPVLAAAEGTVVWAGLGLYKGPDSPDDPYGLAVAIRHDFGFDRRRLFTIYAHMDRVDVHVGQHVKAGEPVGIVGNTGFSTGPHLHFEVRVERNSYYVSRNPELWLSPPQGWGVLVARLMKSDGSLIHRLDATVYSSKMKRSWGIRTYAPTSVNSDDFYRENLVLSDLPAGDYTFEFTWNQTNHRTSFTINPGAVTYLTFRDGMGFSNQLPAAAASPATQWQPADP